MHAIPEHLTPVLISKSHQPGSIHLTDAQTSFKQAADLDSKNPQIRFYLGLTKQLQKDYGFKENFKAAIALYLNHDSYQPQSTDSPILAKLAAYLPQKPSQTDYRPENFSNADQLYQKAIALTPDKPNQVNLAYNRGVLNYRTNHITEAGKILSNAIDIDPNNQFPRKYFETCVVNGRFSASLCESKYVGNSISGKNSIAANKPVLVRKTSVLPSTLPVYACREHPTLRSRN